MKKSNQCLNTKLILYTSIVQLLDWWINLNKRIAANRSRCWCHNKKWVRNGLTTKSWKMKKSENVCKRVTKHFTRYYFSFIKFRFIQCMKFFIHNFNVGINRRELSLRKIWKWVKKWRYDACFTIKISYGFPMEYLVSKSGQKWSGEYYFVLKHSAIFISSNKSLVHWQTLS